MENSIDQIVEERLKVEKEWIEEEWKLRETMIREELKFTVARMEEKLRMARIEVKEKLKQAEERIWTDIMKRNCRTSAENSMKLQFMNKISESILTGEELKGEGNTSIEVSLVYNSTGNIVDVGPESSASVDIVVLKKDFDAFDRDDWTVEEFNEKIVHEVQGKMPLLEGNVHVKLQRGRGVLGKVKFKHHVTKMKPRPEFRLGARIGDLSDGIFVKEAKTESFIVKNYRNKYSKKHEIPSLSDEVWRLHNIRKSGKVYQRLQSEEIYDIEGLLIRFLKDPEGLKNVVGLGLKKWEALIKHARMCPSGNRRYCYINSQKKTGIVFDILGEILGLYSEGQYSSAINMLSENKADADELLSSAINHWGDVVSFDDENSVNQYFKRITTSIDDSNPPGSQYNGHCSTEETPNISNSSSQGIISNSTREIGLKDSADCPLSIDDMEILHDSHYKLSPCSNLDLETMFPGFDREFTLDKDFLEAANVESGILFVAPSEVAIPVCKAPKRHWRKLSYATRLFCVRKRKIVGSSEGNSQAQKKQ